MRKFLLFSTVLLVFSSQIFSQSGKKAAKLLEAGNFPEAITMYEKLIEKDSEKAEYHLKLGECYVRTPQKNSYAIPALQKAISLYKDNSEKGFIDAKFLLGIAYHVNHKFDDAIKTYNELVINKEYKKYKSVDILQNEIRASEAAIEEFKKKKRLKVESPGNAINTEYTQHSPFLIEEQGKFIYTSKEKTKFLNEKTADGEYDENIFFILIDNENDTEPDAFDSPINSKDNEANCWVSKDGNTMLLYKDGDIYRSFKTGNTWSKHEKFKEVNSKNDETHASMNDDQTIVYFSSDRPGGKGGKDIYYIIKTGQDKWSTPVSLNSNVNTKFDEESPYIHQDGTLYFSSKGHNSIGGYDIFSAKGISDTKFEKAENLGMPVNSVEDDVFYFVTSDNKRAFFMSKRPEGKGRGDIFMVNYTDSSMYYLLVKGNVSSEENSNDVTIYSVSTKTETYNTKTDASGNYSYKAERGENYFALLEAQDHFFEAFTFSVPFNDEFEKDLGTKNLDKIESGNINKVYSLEFENNDSELNNENHLFLDAFSDFMSKHSNLVINISANKNTDEEIAGARKQKIITYLTNKGIAEDMIKQDLLTYNNDEDVFLTITEKGAQVVEVVEVIENVKGEYTIQLGAFERKIPNTHRFFKGFKGQVVRRDRYAHTTDMVRKCSNCGTYYHHDHSIDTEDAFVGGPHIDHNFQRYNLLRLKLVLQSIGKNKELKEYEKRYPEIIDELKLKLLENKEIKENFMPYVIETLVDFYIINDNWTALKEDLLQFKNPRIVLDTAKDLIQIYDIECRDYKFPFYRNYRDCTKDTGLKLTSLIEKHSEELIKFIHKYKNSKDEAIKQRYNSVVSSLKYSKLK